MDKQYFLSYNSKSREVNYTWENMYHHFLQVVQAAWWCKNKNYVNPKHVWNEITASRFLEWLASRPDDTEYSCVRVITEL